MAPGFCDGCRVLSDTLRLDKGLTLCPTCTLSSEPCAEYQHDYRGIALAGTWRCLRCGAELYSQSIATGPLPEEP